MARLDPDVRSRFHEACARLEAAGIRLEDASVPHASETPAIYLHIVLSEAAAFHAPALEQRPLDYTPAVRLRLEMGRTILAEDYVRALRGRDVLRREVDAALEGRDGLILPALAVPATLLGADTVMVDGIEEQVRSITLRQTQLFNLTGHPAISIPCGTTGEGLPVGLQVVGRTTPALLDLARRLEPLLTT